MPFAKYHKDMLVHCKELMECQNGLVAIPSSKIQQPITALRTTVEKGVGTLDKEATSYDDLLDSLRLSLIFWH